MRSHILARNQGVLERPSLNAPHLLLDANLEHFSQEVSNPLALASMVGGGLAYRASHLLLGRLAVPLLEGTGAFTRLFVQGAIKGISLTAEVATFRRIGHGEGDVFAAREFVTDLLNFSLLKSVGHAGRTLTPALNHALQAGTMTLGHQVAYRLGLATRPEGNLFQQLLQAELMVVQMNASLGLLQGISGGKISMIERRMDVEIQSTSWARQIQRPVSRETFLPTFRAQAEEAKTDIIARNQGIIHDVRNFLSGPRGWVKMISSQLEPLPTSSAKEALSAQLTKIKEKVERIVTLFDECTEHQISIQQSTLQGADPANIMGRHVDVTLFAISETVQIADRALTNFSRVKLLVEENAQIRDKIGTYVGKLGMGLEKLKISAHEQEKYLQNAQLPGIVSLTDVLREAWFLSGNERRLSQIETADPTLPAEDVLLHINRYSLAAALLNLLINSSHAMRKSGRRNLHLRGFEEIIAGERFAVIDVEDTGTGIAKEHQDHIFKPKFTTKPLAGSGPESLEEPVGTGMGLFMVSEMIQQYGGKIELQTNVGQGTLFRIRLKAFDPEYGLDEHLVTVERTPQSEAEVRGRRYTQANLTRAEQEFVELAQLIHAEPEASMTSTQRGSFLAGLAKHILIHHPYPICQSHLIRLHRMLELAYARLDFEMIDAYQKAVDPEVQRYISIVITQANRLASPESHLVPMEAMNLSLPGIYTVPSVEALRAEHANHFSSTGDRSVYETRQLFMDDPEALPIAANAFMNNFKNALHPLFTALRLFELKYPERSRDDLFTADFSEEPLLAPQQETARNALGHVREFLRILRSPDSPYHQRFLRQLFQDEGPNLQLEYDLLHQILSGLRAPSLEAFGLASFPSRRELTPPLSIPELE